MQILRSKSSLIDTIKFIKIGSLFLIDRKAKLYYSRLVAVRASDNGGALLPVKRKTVQVGDGIDAQRINGADKAVH